MPKLRVLVVDDHDVVRRVVCVLLSKEPTLDVICQTASGEDAVKKAAELHPDLVILDIGLPGISGIEAARQILQVSPTSRIIFLSQHDSIQMAREASRAGGAWVCLQDRCFLRTANSNTISGRGTFLRKSAATASGLDCGVAYGCSDVSAVHFGYKTTKESDFRGRSTFSVDCHLDLRTFL